MSKKILFRENASLALERAFAPALLRSSSYVVRGKLLRARSLPRRSESVGEPEERAEPQHPLQLPWREKVGIRARRARPPVEVRPPPPSPPSLASAAASASRAFVAVAAACSTTTSAIAVSRRMSKSFPSSSPSSSSPPRALRCCAEAKRAMFGSRRFRTSSCSVKHASAASASRPKNPKGRVVPEADDSLDEDPPPPRAPPHPHRPRRSSPPAPPSSPPPPPTTRKSLAASAAASRGTLPTPSTPSAACTAPARKRPPRDRRAEGRDALQIRARGGEVAEAQTGRAVIQVVVLAVPPRRVRLRLGERRGDPRRQVRGNDRGFSRVWGGSSRSRGFDELGVRERLRERLRSPSLFARHPRAPLDEGVDLHAADLLEEEGDGLRVNHRVDDEVDVEPHDALARAPLDGFEPPRAHEALEEPARGVVARVRLRAHGLGRARALVGERDVRDVALVEEPEADLELRLEVARGGAAEHARARAEGHELVVPVDVRDDLEELLGGVAHRLRARERLRAELVEVGHAEEAASGGEDVRGAPTRARRTRLGEDGNDGAAESVHRAPSRVAAERARQRRRRAARRPRRHRVGDAPRSRAGLWRGGSNRRPHGGKRSLARAGGTGPLLGGCRIF